MKTNKIEYVFIVLCLLAIVTKILELPFTGILTVLSFSLYGIYNLVFGVVKLKLFKSSLNKTFSVLVGLGTFTCSVSIMSIFMSVNNARLFLLISAILTIAISFLIRLMAWNKDNNNINYLFKKSLIFGLIVFGIWCLPKYTIFKLKHLKDPKLVELYINKEELKTDSARTAFSNYIDELRMKRKEHHK